MHMDQTIEGFLLELKLGKQKENLKILFPSDPKGNTTIQLKNMKFVLKKCFLIDESNYFKQKCTSETSTIKITQPFKEQNFLNVLSLLFGFTILMEKGQILSYYSIANFLQIPSIQAKLKEDMLKNPSNYGIFTMFKISYLYNEQDLFELCHQRLNREQFAQLEYEKYEFQQLDLSLVKLIVKMHKKYKMDNKNKGLSYIRVDQILRDYCHANSLDEDRYTELKYQLFDPNILNSKEYKEIFLDEMMFALISQGQKTSPTRLNNSMTNSTLLESNANSQTQLSMQHTFERKKNNQLKFKNDKLEEELTSMRITTTKNQKSFAEMEQNLIQMRKQLTKRQDQANYQEKLIKKYQQMFLIMQKELEKKSEQISFLTDRFKELEESSRRTNITIENNICVESQFLPAHLFQDVVGKGFDAKKNNKSGKDNQKDSS